MNEYAVEFSKIYEFLKLMMYECSNFLETKGVQNPFTDDNKQRYIEVLNQCKNDEQYLSILNQFIISVHSGHLLLKNIPEKEMVPIEFRYLNGKYFAGFPNGNDFDFYEVKKIDGIVPEQYILSLPGFSYDKENNKPYKLEFNIENNGFPLELILKNEKGTEIQFSCTDSMSKSQLSEYVPKVEELTKQGNIRYRTIDNIMYIGISNFSGKNLSTAEDTLNELLKKVQENNLEDVILDIRGNGGGSDEYFKLLGMFSSQSFEWQDKYQFIAGNITTEELNTFQKTFDIEEANARVKQNLPVNKVCDFKIEGKAPSVKRIYLLTDAFNYSSADKFVNFAKDTGFATVIGKSTSGDGLGVTIMNVDSPILRRNNIYFIVPSSGPREYTDEFFTSPDVIIEEKKPLTKFEYGSDKDEMLNETVNRIKNERNKGDGNMNNELNNQEESMDKVVLPETLGINELQQMRKAATEGKISPELLQEIVVEENNTQNENLEQTEEKQQEKGPQKKIGTYPKQRPNNYGFADKLLITLLAGFVGGVLATTLYIFINLGKFTFTI